MRRFSFTAARAGSKEDDGDLMGDGVNIAARLEGIAAPAAICLSRTPIVRSKGGSISL
jgi:class 3 adenylate cyclase